MNEKEKTILKIGEEYNVEIESEGSKGDGIAKINGLVLFVKNGKKGKRYNVRVINVKEKFAFAEII